MQDADLPRPDPGLASGAGPRRRALRQMLAGACALALPLQSPAATQSAARSTQALATAAAAAPPLPAPLSVAALRALAAEPQPLQRLGAIDAGPGYSAELVAYRHAGLLLHALVATPLTPAPPRGHPVLVANHGFHPDPPRYGFTPEGRDWRPGNYYRPVPAAYAGAGFLVVMPDYRGHHRSEGFVYTRSALAASYYAEDVAALLGALPALAQADLSQLFMWGHSMGGEVTLSALLATDAVRGASLWSTSGGDLTDRAWQQSRGKQPLVPDSHSTPKPALDALQAELAALGSGFDSAAIDPQAQLAQLAPLRTPLLLQHAVADSAAAYANSARLAARLYRLGKRYTLHSYAGDEHFFSGADFNTAVARDLAFFRSLMAAPAAASR